MNKNDNYNNKKIYNFRLEKQAEEDVHNPNERQFSFYQICQFPIDKLKKRYLVRKLIYNEEAEVLRYSEKKIKKKILDNFLKKMAAL